MKEIKGLLGLILIIIFSMSIGSFAVTDTNLTEEEELFIEENSKVITAVDPQFSPYEFIDSDGIYKGIAADYLKLIEIKTGLHFEIQKDLTWSEAYDKALAGEVDLLPCIGITEQRKDAFLFSDVYLTYQRVMLARDDSSEYSVDDISEIKVGVQKNSSHYSYLMSEFDEVLNLELYTDNDALLTALSAGEIDVAISNYASSRFRVKQLGLTNIRIEHVFNEVVNEFGMAINPDKEILLSIINKGLGQITEEERIDIQNKWLGIEQVPDYSRLIWVIVVTIVIVAILIVIFTYWNYSLQKEIKRRKEVEAELIEASERAVKADEAKSTFLAHMSHEIRTPLNAINGLAYLLENTNTSVVQMKYINNLKDASHNLLNIINDILDFSKIEAGEVVVENVEFDVDQLLNKVSSLLMPKAKSKGLDFYVKKDVRLPNKFIGDPTRIEQIMVNFLSNAIKFTEHGEVELNVDLLNQTDDGCMVRFSVKDTGIGISGEQKDRLFTPFHQLDSSVSRKYGGTGLGLSISKNISELLNGKIEVGSTLGVGSMFSLIVPLEHIELEDAVVDIKRYPNLQNVKVLLVDEDNRSNAIVLEYLSAFGLEADVAVNLKEAYRLIDKNREKYNLIIVEMNLTGAVGLDIVEYVKNIKVEIIIIASQVKESQYELAADLGVSHLVMKPVISSILFDSILQCFQESVSNQDNLEHYDVDKVEAHNILLVDDSEVNQLVEKEILEQKGYTVTLANNGQEAINMVKEHNKFEIILMDINMPVIDGYEATKAIRIFDKEIPIIAMTAEAFSEIRERTMNVGMNDFVTKPFNPSELFSKIESYAHKYNNSEIDYDNHKGIDKEIVQSTSNDPYIDYKQGLIRVGNNERLYCEILEKFYNENINSAENVGFLINNHDYDTAHKLLHKIKGTSGNVGASLLYQSTKTLMISLNEGIELDMGPYLWEFQMDMNKTMESIWELCGHHMKGIVDIETLDKEAFIRKLIEMSNLLSTGDMDAVKLYEELNNEVYNIPDEQWKKVNGAMDKYDFKEANKLVKKILETI